MKKTVLLMALVTLLALGGQAFATLCTIDNVPAATLLVPSFVVDIDACDDPQGLTTLFSVNNASAATTVAHVTLWTDQSVPVLDFDVYLTGFDVQTINLRDIFCSGILPQTGYYNGGNTISNRGAFSDPKVPVLGCNNTTTPGDGPLYSVPFSFELVTLLQEWFTGQPSSALGTCAGSGQAGNIATGYITIDQVNECSLLFPSQTDYYTAGVIGYENILWGDYFIVDPVNNFSQGFTSVHIEAAPTGFFLPGEKTFYQRYDLLGDAGRREPLGTTYAARFALAAPFDGTLFYVWREADASDTSYSCALAGPSSWYPLLLDELVPGQPVVVFDEQENPYVPQVDPGPSNPLPPDQIAVAFPNEVNIVDVGVLGNEAELDVGGFNYGWAYLNLQEPSLVDAQAWVTYVIAASGRYSVGLDAIQLDTACAAGTTPLPVAGPITSNPGAGAF